MPYKASSEELSDDRYFEALHLKSLSQWHCPYSASTQHEKDYVDLSSRDALVSGHVT